MIAEFSELILIAGQGSLPLHLVKEAQKHNIKVECIALNSSIHKALSKISNCIKLAPTQVLEIVEHIKKLKIQNICFIGKVPKIDFFLNLHKLNLDIINRFKKLKDLSDDTIHFAIVDFLENEHGLKIIDQTIFLKDLFLGPGLYTGKSIDQELESGINYAMRMAKGIAALDIGQSIVVQNQSVIAVESIEGTNACIQRAKKILYRPKGHFIVCKVSKPNQDMRFDVPTIGPNTLKIMPKNSNLVFEAYQNLCVDFEKMQKIALKKNIRIIGI